MWKENTHALEVITWTPGVTMLSLSLGSRNFPAWIGHMRACVCIYLWVCARTCLQRVDFLPNPIGPRAGLKIFRSESINNVIRTSRKHKFQAMLLFCRYSQQLIVNGPQITWKIIFKKISAGMLRTKRVEWRCLQKKYVEKHSFTRTTYCNKYQFFTDISWSVCWNISTVPSSVKV